MKHVGVLLLPPGRDASPPQGYSMSPVPIYTPGQGEERHGGVKFLSKETTQRARLEPRTSRSGVRGVNHSATQLSLHIKVYGKQATKHATCFEKLVQNELKNDVARFNVTLIETSRATI